MHRAGGRNELMAEWTISFAGMSAMFFLNVLIRLTTFWPCSLSVRSSW